MDFLRILTYNDRFGGGGTINDLSGECESSSQHLECTLLAHVKFCNKSATKGLFESAHTRTQYQNAGTSNDSSMARSRQQLSPSREEFSPITCGRIGWGGVAR